MADGRRHTELVFLHRGPLPLRAIAVVIVAAGCGVAGYWLFRLHEDLAARVAAGAPVNPLQAFIAAGSSAATLWPGWAAALCFTVALLRLHRGPMEPAPARLAPEERSITQLRRGLRGEYTAVRVLLSVITVLGAVDSARALAFAIGSQRAGASAFAPWAVYLEAAGLIAAAVVLAVYAWTFGADIARLGA